MTDFETAVMQELLLIEELERLAEEGYQRGVAASLEAGRRQAFLVRVLEERLHGPQRKRFYRSFQVAARGEQPRIPVLNTGMEFDL